MSDELVWCKFDTITCCNMKSAGSMVGLQRLVAKMMSLIIVNMKNRDQPGGIG